MADGGARAARTARRVDDSGPAVDNVATGSIIQTSPMSGRDGRTADAGEGVFLTIGHGRGIDWPAGVQQHL